MKLLFDHNLSPKLVSHLAEHFPDSVHVHHLGLDSVADPVIWDYARTEGLILVTKDADFSDLSVLLGFPPKVIWIRRGNCKTVTIASILLENRDAIANLIADDRSGLLTLF